MNAWATLVDNYDYLKEVVALATSLRKVKSKYPLIVMIPVGCIDEDEINKIKTLNLNIIIKQIPYFLSSFSSLYDAIMINKFSIFTFTEYNKIIFLDSDNFIRSNIDDFFNKQFPIMIIREEDNRSPMIHGGFFGIKPDLSVYSFIISMYMNHQFENDEVFFLWLYQNNFFPINTFMNMTCNNTIVHQGGYPKYWFKYNTYEDIINFINITNNDDIHIILNDYSPMMTSGERPLQEVWLNKVLNNIKTQYETI